MNTPVILLGAGGHAGVLIDILCLCSTEILGLTDADCTKVGNNVHGVRVLGDDDVVLSHSPDRVMLVNGLGSTVSTAARRALFERFKVRGYRFLNVVHPSAVVSARVMLGEGVHIMAGTVVQPGVTLGDNAIVNTSSSVDHDSRIGRHAHVATGVTICGRVVVGDGAHIGTGANVIQGVCIGRDSLVGAGALVLDDVPDGATVMGIPAKRVE